MIDFAFFVAIKTFEWPPFDAFELSFTILNVQFIKPLNPVSPLFPLSNSKIGKVFLFHTDSFT